LDSSEIYFVFFQSDEMGNSVARFFLVQHTDIKNQLTIPNDHRKM
jgi:hypothetical protein